MRRDAADLTADLAMQAGDAASSERQARARKVGELTINNAYRSASQQFGIWNRNFLGYYKATQAQRQASEGGEHGAAAAELLRAYIGVRVAAPGFSNHQGGIAVDFALKLKPDPNMNQGPATLGASMAQNDP
jgi:LAS superfamily LD-carboxypeptidase LdcB